MSEKVTRNVTVKCENCDIEMEVQKTTTKRVEEDNLQVFGEVFGEDLKDGAKCRFCGEELEIEDDMPDID